MANPEQKPETAAPAATPPAATSPATAAAAPPEPAPGSSPLPAGPNIAEVKAEPSVHETPTALETAGVPEAKPEDKKEPAKAETKAPQEKAAEPKPAEKPAEKVEVKPAEAKPAEPAKPEPIEYKYTVPETLKLDDASRGELNKALDDFRADPSVGVQKIVDVGAKLMTNFVDQERRHQRDVFAETNKTWHQRILADDILGGSAYQTTQATVARMRDALVPASMLQPRKWDDGSPRMSEFQEFCRVTGAGNHPVFWHILHNAAAYVDEPQARNMPSEIKPPADIGRDSTRRRGAQILYDNPRSQNGRG